MQVTRDVFGQPMPGEEALRQSKIRMTQLGLEYKKSAEALKARIKELSASLLCIPLEQRADAERRISILKQEVREAGRQGAAAGGFYTTSRCFIPKKSNLRGCRIC